MVITVPILLRIETKCKRKMDNLDNWERMRKPPKEALKTIRGGRLTGMTDINPQWRYRVMTEVYGPCGKGWDYAIDKLWLEPGPAGTIAAFAHITLGILSTKGLRECIPGVGGSMFIAEEKGGLRVNDEAYKMAITDALSVAMKMLGVGADIYMGRYDGSKYADEKPLKGPILPSDGIAEDYESHKVDNEKIETLCYRLVSMYDKNDYDGVRTEYDAANLESAEKLALWAALTQTRNAVKAVIKNRNTQPKGVANAKAE
jgi:hypothetical protein